MVIASVSYSFTNVGSGYNAVNYSTGTSYLNKINTNQILLKGSDLTTTLNNQASQIASLTSQIATLTNEYITNKGVFAVPSISAGGVVDITVTIPNYTFVVSSVSPIIHTTINNKTNVVYINECYVMGVSYVGISGANYIFHIRVSNNYPTTTIPANNCYVGYTITSN